MLFHLFIVTLFLQSLLTAGCPGFVSRKVWGAVDPVRVQYLKRPVSIVIIQNTATETCSTDETCEASMRAIQKFFIDDLMTLDIGSSFYVGGNGKIYEGAGWLQMGAHTIGYNRDSIGICFIGNYDNIVPTKAQLDAVKDLLSCGVEEGYLTQNYHVIGHKQAMPSDSPGRKLYKVIQSWPEWAEDVSTIKPANI